ncbi:YolD-like family protein [Fervidibacillus halotolerans]|uniref:YolD-like family protein n=1 Tax=Fervidibacillus halotolerans TaxID=2980027 RepID=A0A9E8S1T1_9BACI|nr:YolD-like family protein [Fervidibacillus halotolerans]WAA13832.1 YolD-like family protein [Fervidibacillus halotolerans]
MIRDRGRIKWTAMMLPEHVKLLREWTKEDEWEKRSEPDGQMLEQMDQIVQRARMTGEVVTVRYYEDHRYERITGRIDSFDIVSKCLRMKDECNRIYCIPIAAIDRIELDG